MGMMFAYSSSSHIKAENRRGRNTLLRDSFVLHLHILSLHFELSIFDGVSNLWRPTIRSDPICSLRCLSWGRSSSPCFTISGWFCLRSQWRELTACDGKTKYQKREILRILADCLSSIKGQYNTCIFYACTSFEVHTILILQKKKKYYQRREVTFLWPLDRIGSTTALVSSITSLDFNGLLGSSNQGKQKPSFFFIFFREREIHCNRAPLKCRGLDIIWSSKIFTWSFFSIGRNGNLTQDGFVYCCLTETETHTCIVSLHCAWLLTELLLVGNNLFLLSRTKRWLIAITHDLAIRREEIYSWEVYLLSFQEWWDSEECL